MSAFAKSSVRWRPLRIGRRGAAAMLVSCVALISCSSDRGSERESLPLSATEEESSGSESSAPPRTAGLSSIDGAQGGATDDVDGDSVAGIWVNDGSAGGYWASVLVRFDDTGRFAIGNTGRVDGGAYQVGDYDVDGESIAFVADDARDCPGREFAWRVELEASGIMQSEVVSGAGCARVGTSVGWIRVSPASSAGAALVAGDRVVEPRTPTSALDLFGVWLKVGTGQVLQVRLDDTFALDDTGDLHASPTSAGSITVEADSLKFVTAASTDCPDGTTWEWSEVTLADDLVQPSRPRGTTMRAVGPSGSCGDGTVEELTWRLLSGGER